MALIRCPKCGQRALSVATTCPRCGHLLAQSPVLEGGASGLVACRRCRKLVEPSARECVFCGYPASQRRIARRVLWSSVAVLVVVTAGLVVFRASTGGEAGPAVEQPEVVGSAAEEFSPAQLPQPASPVPGEVPSAAETLPPLPTRPARATTRWTLTWANVRAERDTASAVLEVLRPGARVEVAEWARGWWAVRRGGTRVGYIAGSVVTADSVAARDSAEVLLSLSPSTSRLPANSLLPPPPRP